ncbi:DUF5518 domain-containing protein [Halomicrobium salinisoli]|uniref:DUF5518 domain-containing protein n=1 Tax=Halomicrobium salinisoli TaxID=2878391 RepID=UPI001CEFC2B4|nr:DUF5518 domain-containing protein [Halomicrobium salinisoli]
MSRVLVDAAAGAVVTLALSFLPFSSLAGGASAAYRDGGGYWRSFAVGALSGAVAGVPLLALFAPALWLAGRLGFGIPPGAPAYDLFLAIAFALFACYTVGLSAVGGLAGAAIRRHTEFDLDPASVL